MRRLADNPASRLFGRLGNARQVAQALPEVTPACNGARRARVLDARGRDSY
ncbi:hypothetical protein CT19431_MP70140 [Cupriavidus taiwanensis]|nr:hypothetical protein CT19431_MP70140 [Cupriavidus taiwanensis]